MELEGESGQMPERSEKPKQEPKIRAVEELLQLRTESQITIEATVDTGFEFMAMEECREKFGQDFHVLKERGSIMFNIEKSKYPEVLRMRSVDNLYLVLSYSSSLGLKGVKSVEDVDIVKKEAHTPDWDQWLAVWKDLSAFEGILKPTPEQHAAANERAKKDKEAEKLRQAERQKKYKERQEKNAENRARRKAKFDLKKAQRLAAQKVDLGIKSTLPETSNTGDVDETVKNDNANPEELVCIETCSDNPNPEGPKVNDNQQTKNESQAVEDTIAAQLEDELHVEKGKLELVAAETDSSVNTLLMEDEVAEVLNSLGDTAEKVVLDLSDVDDIQSLPDYDKDVEREIDSEVPPGERVLRFRATCFRVGKHSFGSMEVAREFGGELQEKFNWVVDLVNFNAEVVISLFKDTAQVSIALTKRSLHRRNISFFGPTTLRSTVCHNLLRLADIKPGDIVLDPLSGGGSIPIECAMSFPGIFHLGGDIHPKAMSRFYSNVRCLQDEIGKALPVGAVWWDSRRLPLKSATVDVIVSDLPFGVRQGSKSSNRNLYQRVLMEMARVVRPGTGRAVLLTQDRKSFSLALVSTMGLWWQSRVMSVNIGGLDAAVFTLKRTSKVKPDESDLAAAAAQAKEKDQWHSTSHRGNRGGQRGWGRGGGRGRGRGRSYPRGKHSGGSKNWRDDAQKPNKTESQD